MNEVVEFPRERRERCQCETPSEYLLADVDGWRCQTCRGYVPRLYQDPR